MDSLIEQQEKELLLKIKEVAHKLKWVSNGDDIFTFFSYLNVNISVNQKYVKIKIDGLGPVILANYDNIRHEILLAAQLQYLEHRKNKIPVFLKILDFLEMLDKKAVSIAEMNEMEGYIEQQKNS